MIKLGQIVLKGVNWVHNDRISLNGIDRSQLGIQCKNQVIWSVKGVNWVHYAKIRSYGLEMNQLGTQ